MTEHILPERQPSVALIWSSEPDKAQHAHGVGSEMSDRAIRQADARFGSILEWLENNGRASDTDVLVISDHGYSTIQETVDVAWYTRDAGFASQDVIVAPNGGSVLFYCRSQDVTQRLAVWLTERPWCGALLASEAAGEIEGALPMALAGAEGPRAPELAMSFGWDSRPNDAGYKGYAYSSGGQPGQGQHGSMSRHEMNNVLLARGPSFKQASRIQSPTGNVDLAPTVLRLLGIPAPDHMEGRALVEALADGKDSVDWSSTTHRAERKTSSGMYCQTVRVSTVGDTSYIDEGSGWLATD